MIRNVTFALVIAASTATPLFPLAAAEPKADDAALRVVRDKNEIPIAIEAVRLGEENLKKWSKLADADEKLARVLAVYVAENSQPNDLPAMAGTFTVTVTSLRFEPRFPFLAGTRYKAILWPTALVPRSESNHIGNEAKAKPIVLEFTIPAEAQGEPTEVVHVYPSSAILPENNLRFYIHFSESMGRGEAYQHVHLQDARGKPIEETFLEIGEELWDPRARRLTLLIEPGRIKKGVKPREELGPVLESGRDYTLVINRAWRDAAGRPLKAEFKKKFRAGPPVEVAIDPAQWTILPAGPGSNDPLVVRFPVPLDRALLDRTITVAALDGPVVAGRVSVSNDERCWEFRPHAPWKAGRYQLVVDTALEDLAGNRIGKPFEVDEFSEVEKAIDTETFRLPFEVRERT